MDGLSQLTRQYRVMIASGYRLILLLSSAGGPALPVRPFRPSVSYQACMYTPIPEVHPPGDLCLDLLGPADTQRLCADDVSKEKGPLGITGPLNYPRHSADSMAMKQLSTATEGVMYQLADCEARRIQ